MSPGFDLQSLYQVNAASSSASTFEVPYRSPSDSSNVNPYTETLLRQENEIRKLSEKVSALESAAEKASETLETLRCERNVQQKISGSFSKTMDMLFWVIVFLSVALIVSVVGCLASFFRLDISDNVAQWAVGLISFIGIGAICALCRWLYSLSRINRRIEKLEESISDKQSGK